VCKNVAIAHIGNLRERRQALERPLQLEDLHEIGGGALEDTFRCQPPDYDCRPTLHRQFDVRLSDAAAGPRLRGARRRSAPS
jgi:hypothetical protein